MPINGGERAILRRIDFEQSFGIPSSPDRGLDLRFEFPSSAAQAGARAAAALKGPRALGVARASSDKDKRVSSPGRMLAGLRGGGVERRRPGAGPGDGTSRRVTRAAAKATSQGPGAPSAAKNVFEISDQEDECVDVDEHVVRKHNCEQLPVSKRKSEGKSPSDDDDREQSARPAAKNDNKEAAAPPEEIFEALRAISGLDHDDLLRAYSKLIRDDRQFRSLMALPEDMRKDWLLMEIGNQ
ncbi:unnamed protein product [Urochloa humidicola]